MRIRALLAAALAGVGCYGEVDRGHLEDDVDAAVADAGAPGPSLIERRRSR